MQTESHSAEPDQAALPQFSLQTLLGAVFFICCLLAGAKIGLAAFVSAALPLGILGWAILRGVAHRRALVGSYLPLISCFGLAIFTVLIFRPADLNTWFAISGGVLWSLVFLATLKRYPHWLRLAPPVLQTLLLLYCIAPRLVEGVVIVEVGHAIQDIQSGRKGISFLGMTFITSDTNTALLEDYLGPLKPRWQHQCYLSPHIRDGNERVDVCSLVFHEELPEILEKLPDEAARKQVLRCLTDSENRLRAHQGLLLITLHCLGYPPGYNAETWWEQHSILFRQEKDAELAAKAIFGWRERIEKSAPSYHDRYPIEKNWEISRQSMAAREQERGSWGGNIDMAEAYWDLELSINVSSKPIEDFSELGLNRVAWWPISEDWDETHPP